MLKLIGIAFFRKILLPLQKNKQQITKNYMEKQTLKITITEENGGMFATIEGRLDTPSAIKAQQDIVPLLENADKTITLNCKDMEYISSSGLRLFLTLRKEAAAKGGKVVITNINDEIKKVFMMTGFFNLFEITNA